MWQRFLFLLALTNCLVVQLTPDNFDTHIQNNKYAFVNLYSPTCPHCQQLFPKMNELDKKFKGQVFFGKLDLTIHQEFMERYRVSSFPTLLLFLDGFDLPLEYRGEREANNIMGWIKQEIGRRLTKDDKKEQDRKAVFHIQENSSEYELAKAIASRHPGWKIFWQQNDKDPYVSVGDWLDNEMTHLLERKLKQQFARLQDFDEQPWVDMFNNRNDGIIFVNKNNDKEMLSHLQNVSRKHPNIVFTHIEQSHPEFPEVIKYFGIYDEQSVVGIKNYKGIVNRLGEPVTSDRFDDFLQKFIDESWPQHRKSQKSLNKHMLTLDNFNELMDMPKDILLFLFSENDPKANRVLRLADKMIEVLRNNENVHVFVCNLDRNDITLETAMEPLPKIIFYQYGLKSRPIDYPYSNMPLQAVIDFVKQNTVFDWPADQL